MIAFFRNLWWRLRYPWPRTMIMGLRPLRISVCPESRFSECERLYDENVPHGVPADHRDEYASTLRSNRLLTLIAEDEGKVVGTFGVQYGEQYGTYWLCYLLVSPEHHGKGIGTTLFFSSIALLPEDHPHLNLCIVALPGAARFYHRLGFLRVGQVEYSKNEIHQVAVMHLWRQRARDVRSWFLAANVKAPTSGYEIPLREVTSSPAPSPGTPTHPPSLQ
jgi:predicted N-acetyltransferase YhbS